MEIGITLNNELVKNFDFSKKDKQEIKSLNEWIGQVKKKDTRLYKILIFTVAGVALCSTNVHADVKDAMNGIDKVGIIFLTIFQRVGKWGCILGCFIEILKSLISTGTKDIWKIFAKYFVIYMILYMLPWMFDIVAEIFSSL